MKRFLAILGTAALLGLSGCSRAPVAAFSASPLEGPPPLTVQFTDESTGSPVSWDWDFGDGNTSTEQNPINTYTNGGTYDVLLVVSNDNGSDSATTIITVGDQGFERTDTLGMTLQWKVNETNVEIKLSAPTRGWVAVGFDPSSMMKDANFIIGYVQGQDAFISDHFGNGSFSHASDSELGGSDDLVDKHGTESAGSTQISFIMPLNSGDSYDRVLEPGQTYKVILAYGPDGADDFTTKHAAKIAVNITL